MQHSFMLFSAYLILLSYYIQNLNIYKNHIHNDYIINKYIIEEQLTNLKFNLNNKFNYWTYQYTIFAIAIVLIVFHIGNSYKYIFIGLSVFLFIQYYIEYFHFYIPTLIKMEEENKSPMQVLNEMEKTYSHEKIKLNKYQQNINIDNLKTKQDYYSYIIGEPSNLTHITDNISKIRAYKNNDLLELDLVEKTLYKIEEKDSKYYNSFYSHTNYNRIFVFGLVEPLFMSIILMLSLQ